MRFERLVGATDAQWGCDKERQATHLRGFWLGNVSRLKRRFHEPNYRNDLESQCSVIADWQLVFNYEFAASFLYHLGLFRIVTIVRDVKSSH